MESQAKTKDLEDKLKLLDYTVSKTDKILVSENQQAIERQLIAIKNVAQLCESTRREVELYNFTQGVDEETIKKSDRNVELRLQNSDEAIHRINEFFKELEVNREAAEQKKARVLREEENAEKEKARQKREELENARKETERLEQLKFEAEVQEIKLKGLYKQQEIQEKLSQNLAYQATGQQTKAELSGEILSKLPRIEIDKYDGSPLDFPRFWNQFKENIEKRNIKATNKLSYLLSYLTPKVKCAISGLPYDDDGYEAAKRIMEEQYGKESDVVNAYIQEIMELPNISGANPRKIHDFHAKLNHAVNVLQTMGKLECVNGNVPMTISKLSGIRGDLVRTDPKWTEWGFVELVQALQEWKLRNPIESQPESTTVSKGRVPTKLYQAQKEFKPRGCVYCDKADHKSSECPTVTAVEERKRVLVNKRLCFNCTNPNHRVATCPSKSSCRVCRKRHHTSIHEENTPPNPDAKITAAMTTSHDGDGVFPVVTIEVNGVRCRALIDSGAGSSYISAKLVKILNLKPTEKRATKIDMLMATKTAHIDVYQTQVSSLCGNHSLNVEMLGVGKQELLSVKNPKYRELTNNYAHLEGVVMYDYDTKDQLPVHVILGNGEFSKIKTDTRPRVGAAGEPVAELTKFGWFIMSPGNETTHSQMMLTQTTQLDYEELCKLDVLGLADRPDQQDVYAEFKEQLTRSQEGWYETALPWKGNHPKLPTNEEGSKRRLRSLLKRLQRQNLVTQYDDIIQEQLAAGVIERAPANAQKNEFYIPHKPVIRETAETTKLRVVYDASARATPEAPSLNDCLHAGPPLQNQLWAVLVRQRAYPIVLAGDVQKAFLQVRVREKERDALRFHWHTDANQPIQVYRFARVLFGLTSSPFLLGGVIQSHLETWARENPAQVKHLLDSLYVDDVITGGDTNEKVHERKEFAIEALGDASFKLHKWNSNVPEFEDKPSNDGDATYAKEQLGTGPTESKLLGVKWNKEEDTLKIPLKEIAETDTPLTKRGVLSRLAKVYDPLGIASPVTLQGKLIYRQACEAKVAWDADLPENIQHSWKKWDQGLPNEVQLPRALAPYQEPIQDIQLHAFGDASSQGVGAAIYSVVRQQSGTTTNLVAAKARLAKQGLTIPRLELISAHMATNLLQNVAEALCDQPVTQKHGWLDSTVALHWIRGNGQYRQFVSNRIEKIQQHSDIQWHHVPTEQNPADLASRGGSIDTAPLWMNGPSWLDREEDWPYNPVTTSTPTSEAEAKLIREVLNVAQPTAVDEFDSILHKHGLRKSLRILAYARRFITKAKGYMYVSAEETEAVRKWWIKRTQQKSNNKKISETLNLQPDPDGILLCKGRIQGQYPVYLPRQALLTRKLVEEIHVQTLHGGVVLTMAAVRENYWIPKLRSLVKSVRTNCYGCKRFRAVPYAVPPPGMLPKDRTTGGTAFEVIGVDLAGPIRYRLPINKEGKAYIVVYACSLSRAVYLDLLKKMETPEFIQSLKGFIARRGRPRVIYSDNGGTFVSASKWLTTVQRDEKLQGVLEGMEIKWRFNLSRAPWWGGQFERLIHVIKSAFYKEVGGATLNWSELSEVLLDVETQINRRPLSYVEDDLELPTLTPTSFLHQRENHLPELASHHHDTLDLRKRAKFLVRCKYQLWNRWQKEYLTSLRERHNLSHKTAKFLPKLGDVVIIKTDSKNRGTWPLGIVNREYKGRDGVVRGVELRTKHGTLERAVQLLYPLELNCEPFNELNAEAAPFQPRPRRQAAVAAGDQIKAIEIAENTE